MAKSYLPTKESDFVEWAKHFTSVVAQNPAAYDMTQEAADALVAQFNSFDTRMSESIAARDAASAANNVKDAARQEVSTSIRNAVRMIQANVEVTNAARLDAGLPVHKTSRTPLPAPTTAPVGSVIMTARLEQTLQFCDSDNKRRRPAGVTGVEIYLAIGESSAPVDPADYRYVETCGRSPKVMTFNASDANKVAHYLLRWINTKGETGPWSAPISGTIPAV